MRSERRLADEAARRRRELREEQARHGVTRDALRDANRTALRLALRDLLADPRDFEVYVGVDDVMDEAGRVTWPLVWRLVTEMVATRPYLAIEGVNAGSISARLVESRLTGAPQAQAGASNHGAQRATRVRPGAGENSSPMETP